MRTRVRELRSLLVVLVSVTSMVLLAACGGGSNGGSSADGGGQEVVRFAFAPDPVMKYLVDTGTLKNLEEKWNVKLEMTEAFDEFAFFAGGHGDVVSTSSQEVAGLEQETGIKTVTFGKYNYTHTQILVRTDSPYQTLKDLVGKKVAVGSEGSMVPWGAWAKETENVNFKFEGGDYDIVLNDHAANPELLVRGDVEGCLCPTELAAHQHAKGEVRALYDATISELWNEKTGHMGVMQNVFTATQEYYDAHPRAIAFFLDLWANGLDLWHKNFEEIIRKYPADFNVKEPQDVQWIIDYLAEHDWNVDSVYFDQKWADGEQNYLQQLKDTGFHDPDEPKTRFEPWTAEDVQAQLASKK
jgi:ABC-type nitrate/sulfonate/bicarbonate transport system substrate-binding protein